MGMFGELWGNYFYVGFDICGGVGWLVYVIVDGYVLCICVFVSGYG